jgi:hypothetical protein
LLQFLDGPHGIALAIVLSERTPHELREHFEVVQKRGLFVERETDVRENMLEGVPRQTHNRESDLTLASSELRRFLIETDTAFGQEVVHRIVLVVSGEVFDFVEFALVVLFHIVSPGFGPKLTHWGVDIPLGESLVSVPSVRFVV